MTEGLVSEKVTEVCNIKLAKLFDHLIVEGFQSGEAVETGFHVVSYVRFLNRLRAYNAPYIRNSFSLPTRVLLPTMCGHRGLDPFASSRLRRTLLASLQKVL